ncbi:MAG: competence/damage-inducible protein A [Pseudomonadales bacterium]|nr:competence/damage-inducible protein A [Pseudomonadales bacterium]MBL6814796.1 competence/damage-inducible protein A [Pseudomonadales bacterium]
MNQAVTASVIIIGNEILSGRTQDINLNHIASTLGGWGIQVHHARVIPDDEDIIVNTINEVRTSYDYVFTTGGIGPTHDDITAVCIAKAFDVPVIQHPDIAERIRQRPAPDDIMASRLLMARVPQGAALIDNPSGGPQGFAMENVYVMAGIPRVMQAMLSTLEGKLKSGFIVRSQTIRAYTGESSIADALARIQSDFPSVDIGSYPFLREERYGTHLVIRGADTSVLATVADSVMDAVRAIGEEPEDLGLDADA